MGYLSKGHFFNHKRKFDIIGFVLKFRTGSGDFIYTVIHYRISFVGKGGNVLSLILQ